MKTVVISQPRYLPALNYIHRMRFSDEFILLDTVQRQSRGFENRNKIMTESDTSSWLSVPIQSSSRCLIRDAVIDKCDWVSSHRNQLLQSYKDYPHFCHQLLDSYYSRLREVLQGNYGFAPVMKAGLDAISEFFECDVNFTFASELEEGDVPTGGSSKLAYLAQRVGATNYISGPNGKDYGVEGAFSETKVSVSYHHFDFDIFEYERPILSFWDPLFLLGKDAIKRILNQKPNYV